MNSVARKVDFEIVKAYIESAKSFVQLSSAGLVAPIALKQVWSSSNGSKFLLGKFGLVSMVLSCSLFFLSIGAGALFQR